MILHVWMESGSRMRVRLTSTVDLESGPTTTSYAASTPEVLRHVQAWLDAVTASGADGSPVTHP